MHNIDIAKYNLPSESELEALANQLYRAEDSASTQSVISESSDLGSHNPREHVYPDHQSDRFSTAYGKGDAKHLVTENPSSFDVNNPQTSHPDPFLGDGKIPSSIAGSGLLSNPTAYDLNNDGVFSNVDPNEFFRHEYQQAIPATPAATTALPRTQMPAVFSSSNLLGELQSQLGHPADYYFLKGINPFSSVPASQAAEYVHAPFDINKVKSDFPILNEYVNGHRLIWLDNAATTQKPQAVIDRISYFYQHENSNIHRAAHELAARATDAYEEARTIVQRFVHARSINEIIFTRGTTESINLIANTWGDQFLGKGDEIIVSNLEHHANIVPWQLLAKKKGFDIKVIPVNDKGELLIDEYTKLLNSKTKLVSFTHVSNALGTVTPAKQIIELAHAAGAKVLLDGAQSISHMKVDLQYLNPDFFVFSGHKIFGPTGIGVVYGREDLLNLLQPWQGGGNMIKDVTFEHTQFHQAPTRFEAGTGNIADAVGLGAALEYVAHLGIERINQYEHALLDYATQQFKQIPGVTLIGTAAEKASVMSFTLDGYSNDEVGQVLNEYGVAVRTGHHCAQPILRRLGYETTVRPSFAFYNTCEDINLLADVVKDLSAKRRK